MKGVELLHILREIKNGVTAGRPFRHLKIKRIDFWIRWHRDFDADFEEMRVGMRHC